MTVTDMTVTVIGGAAGQSHPHAASDPVLVHVMDIDFGILSMIVRSNEQIACLAMGQDVLLSLPRDRLPILTGESPSSGGLEHILRSMGVDAGSDYRYREPVPSFLLAPVLHDAEPISRGGPPVRYQDTKFRPPRKLGRKYSRHDNRGV